MNSSINISIPEPLKAWVSQQAELRGFGNEGEYIRDLIERAKAASMRKVEIEQHLLESIASGPAEPMTQKDWEDIRLLGTEPTIK